MKRQKICGIIILCLILFSGCGATLPPMTEAQEDAITEYAAALVMRHTRDYSSRLVDLSLYEEKEPETEQPEEPEAGGMDEVADTPVVDNSSEETKTVYSSIDSLLVPEGVSIIYTGSQILDSYPAGEEADPYFALDASAGKKLLVLMFTVQNTTGEEQSLEVFAAATRCMVQINDTERTHIISTMLLDDLSTYVGSLQAGEEISLVLLAEIDNTLESVEKLELTVNTAEGSVKTLLQ